MRRWGGAVERGRTYRRRPGAYAILWRDGTLLLTLQAEPESEIQLPGGGIDPGESPLRALHREVFEETGWTIAGARRLGAYKRFAYMPDYDLWAEKICHVWLARPSRRIGPPPEQAHAPLWAPPAVALDLLPNPAERDFLRRVLRTEKGRYAIDWA
ncbi:NUDIX hydrolase [Rubellimicrobium rubrum]|uniref:NUDIX hydrolase n=1 Tax=Rubellimicrobium rubrum TaxID=2585369 RepID=A0A5C4MUJ8_9RHOB|nr:NUDIX hydrolase [Rubellimicrobium rubrum]TNC48147.1 NUDIX hydrolase [Rubellimicrobium rubrum]